jgi:hypothetical protein
MPGKAKAKSKSKEGEESIREKKRQQKLNSPDSSDNELNQAHGDKVIKRAGERPKRSDCENALALMELLQADLLSDPTTPNSVEKAMQCLERERVQLIELSSELENSWDHFKSFIISQGLVSLCNYEVSISPVMAIIEIWRSISQKSESGTENKFKEHPKSGGSAWCSGGSAKSQASLLSDSRDCALAKDLFAWMEAPVRDRIDATVEYDRCRPLYDALEGLLKAVEMRCSLMRAYLSDLRDSLPEELFGAEAALQADGYAWSDLACPPAESPLPPSASALRFANPAILLHQSRGGKVAQLRSPPVEIAGRMWVAALCSGEAEGFFGLYVEACNGVTSSAANEFKPADSANVKGEHFSVRISVRRGAAEQVSLPSPVVTIPCPFTLHPPFRSPDPYDSDASGCHGWHVAGA